MSLTDWRGVAVDVGAQQEGRPLRPRDAAALAAAYLHASGVPVPITLKALGIHERTYFRRLNHATDLAAGREPPA